MARNLPSPPDYMRAWKNHVMELRALYWHLPNETDREKLQEHIDELVELIEKASEDLKELASKG